MKYLLLVFLPFLLAFTGPGPRSDGAIYIADYGTDYNDAEADAALISTTVHWAGQRYDACGVIVPEGVINQGVGRSLRGNSGTYLYCANGNAVELVPPAGTVDGGPYTFKDMTINGNGGTAIHAAYETTDVDIENTSLFGNDCVDLAAVSNYPFRIDRFNCTCQQYGILAEHHLGSAHLSNGKFGGGVNGQCVPISITGQGGVVAQHITVDSMDFSLINGVDIYFAGAVSDIHITNVATERYIQAPADISFAPGGNYGHTVIGPNNELGINAARSILNLPSGSIVMGNAFSSPVQAKYPVTDTILGNSGPIPLFVWP